MIALLRPTANLCAAFSGKPWPVFQDLSRGVVARSARDSPTRVRAGSAEVQALDRSSVARPARDGAEDERLVQGHLPVVDVALRQAEPLFQVDRCEDLAVEDQSFQAGH